MHHPRPEKRGWCTALDGAFVPTRDLMATRRDGSCARPAWPPTGWRMDQHWRYDMVCRPRSYLLRLEN